MDCEDERAFLHDLATPISTALFLIDSIMDRLQTNPNTTDRKQLTEIYEGLETVTKMLDARRNILIELGASESQN